VKPSDRADDTARPGSNFCNLDVPQEVILRDEKVTACEGALAVRVVEPPWRNGEARPDG
jgi:hypothetical protein